MVSLSGLDSNLRLDLIGIESYIAQTAPELRSLGALLCWTADLQSLSLFLIRTSRKPLVPYKTAPGNRLHLREPCGLVPLQQSSPDPLARFLSGEDLLGCANDAMKGAYPSRC